MNMTGRFERSAAAFLRDWMAGAACLALWLSLGVDVGSAVGGQEAVEPQETWVMVIRPGRLVPGHPPRVAEFRDGTVSVFPLGPPELVPGVGPFDLPVPPEEGEEASELPEVEEGQATQAGVPVFDGFAVPGMIGCPPASTAYWAVYSSIPFIRSEYEANPSYRHEAAMEILFGQLRPTVVQRVQAPPPPPLPIALPPWFGLPPGHWLTYRFWPPTWGVWW